MEYIQKLPFISGALMAIIIGTISYRQNVDMQALYLRMAVTMLAFYAIGLGARIILQGIIEEINIKKEKEAKESETGPVEAAAEGDEGPEGNNIDYRVDDATGEDDFKPLPYERIPKNTNA